MSARWTDSPYEDGWRPTPLEALLSDTRAHAEERVERLARELTARELAGIVVYLESGHALLDALNEGDRPATFAAVRAAWRAWYIRSPWAQVLTVSLGGILAACCVAGAPVVWAALTKGGW